MTEWRSKVLGNGTEAYNRKMEIMDAFMARAMTNAQTTGQHMHDAAVFSKDNPETHLTTVYFTPSAWAVAVQFGATPCEKPVPDGDFSLLTGETTAWDAHFPEYIKQRRLHR
jgi:hypothetical protein